MSILFPFVGEAHEQQREQVVGKEQKHVIPRTGRK